MGKSKEAYQINSVECLSMLLAMYMEIVFLLKREQLHMSRCIVIVMEAEKAVEQMIRLLESVGAKIERGIKGIRNNEILTAIASKYNSKKIQKYLEAEEVTPILIACGVAPSYLAGEYAIPVENVQQINRKFLQNEIEQFRKFVRSNVDLMMKELRKFKTSAWYLHNESALAPDVSLHAVLAVYQLFYRENHNEEVTQQWITNIESIIKEYMEKMEHCGEETDIIQPVRNLIIKYIDSHPEIEIGNANEVDGALTRALKADQAILYDDEWYYIPQKLFKVMCEPIRQFVSAPEIKRGLLTQGYLYCNNGSAGTNFTVKRDIYNTYGQYLRVRVLKIDKGLIMEDGSLGLEERRGDRCILEKSMENIVLPD